MCVRHYTKTVGRYSNFSQGKESEDYDSQHHPESTVQQKACQEWALRKQKATGRISPAVKEYLTQVFETMKVPRMDTQKQTWT